MVMNIPPLDPLGRGTAVHAEHEITGTAGAGSTPPLMVEKLVPSL